MKNLLFIFSFYSFTAGAGFWDSLNFWSGPDWYAVITNLHFGQPFKIYADNVGN